MTRIRPSDSAGKYLNTVAELCTSWFRLVLESRAQAGPAQGLLAITGATNSSKSKLARGLIRYYYYLDKRLRPGLKRRPHLVTVEDPVEAYFSSTGYSSRCVRYTPRQLGADVKEVSSAMRDALRQTSTVLYVGATRDPATLPDLLEFPALGDLVVATAHAGSLREAAGTLTIQQGERRLAPRMHPHFQKRINIAVNARG